MRREITPYGFIWEDVMVERTCSNNTKPKFKILRVFAMNGEVIEILMRPRSNKVEIFPPEKGNNKNGKRI